MPLHAGGSMCYCTLAITIIVGNHKQLAMFNLKAYYAIGGVLELSVRVEVISLASHPKESTYHLSHVMQAPTILCSQDLPFLCNILHCDVCSFALCDILGGTKEVSTGLWHSPSRNIWWWLHSPCHPRRWYPNQQWMANCTTIYTSGKYNRSVFRGYNTAREWKTL